MLEETIQHTQPIDVLQRSRSLTINQGQSVFF